MGSTTYEEYRHFENDRALARRFQKSRRARAVAATRRCASCKGSRRATRSTTACATPRRPCGPAVDLSVRHLSDRFLPDKAIDVIDEAGAAVRLRPRGRRRKTVGVRDVEDVIARMAHIPAARASLSDRERLEQPRGGAAQGGLRPGCGDRLGRARRQARARRARRRRAARSAASCSRGPRASARRSSRSSSRGPRRAVPALRHERVHGEARGGAADRRAARATWATTRAACWSRRSASSPTPCCCSTRSRRPTPISSTSCCR